MRNVLIAKSCKGPDNRRLIVWKRRRTRSLLRPVTMERIADVSSCDYELLHHPSEPKSINKLSRAASELN
jgi:hypothetical protein